MTKEDKELDILIPEEKVIQVKGKDVAIKKANIKQIIDISKFIANLIATSFSELEKRNLIEKFQSGTTSRMEDIMFLLDVLDENQIAGLVAIVIGKDKKFVIKNFDLEWVLDAFIVFSELNDIGMLLGKVQKLSQIYREVQD